MRRGFPGNIRNVLSGLRDLSFGTHFILSAPLNFTMSLKMLQLLSDEPFGYEADVAISAIAFAITGALFQVAHGYCGSSLPQWEKFSKGLQDRMCVELAIIPLRFGFIYFSFSAVLTAFTSSQNWEAADTKNSLIAWYVVLLHEKEFLLTTIL